MPDKFDPYREALVMETQTIWPSDLDTVQLSQRTKIEAALHGHPEQATHLAYVRTHTGFCRQITVTAEDLQRITG
ncbi:MAG TPA: hypothetical protein VIY86_04890 [Pirellulaceae bacterium]